MRDKQTMSRCIENYEQAYDEVSIDLTNLFGHILIKWKTIVLVSLCTAIIGGIVGGFSFHGSENSTSTNQGSSIAEAAAVLTEEQLLEVEGHYSVIADYDRVIDEQKKYNDEAFIMHLDPLTSIGYTLQYYVETDLSNVTSSYAVSTLNEEDYNKLEDILGTEDVRTGFDEAVTFETTDEADPGDGTSDNAMHRILLTVSIISPDKDTCEKVIEVVNSAISRKTETLKKNGINIECISAYEGYSVNALGRIETAKQKNVSTLGSLITNKANYINNAVAKIDALEKTYLDILLGNLPSETVNPSDEGSYFKKIIRYIFVGLTVGFVISLCWVVGRYVSAARLRTSVEMTEYYGVPVLQTMSNGRTLNDVKKKDIITKQGLKLIGAFEEPRDSLEVLLEELRSVNRREGIRKIYIAVDEASGYAIELAGRITADKSENTYYSEGALFPDAEGMKQLLDADAVIIIPIIDITRLKSINAFMNICKRNNKHIIGTIIVRDRSLDK